MTEQELIRGLSGGDEAAFRQLVEHHQQRVYNTALGLVKDTDEAGDLAQEVFIEIFESIGRFRGESKLSTWIYRLTITKSLESLRRSKRKKRFGLMTRLFQQPSSMPEADLPDFVHPGVLMENRENAAMLFRAIESLPENQKIAFTLHKIEELSYAEIAEIMNVSIPSVESLMHRAKTGLRKKLEKDMQ